MTPRAARVAALGPAAALLLAAAPAFAGVNCSNPSEFIRLDPVFEESSDSRIPIILVHGIHGNMRDKVDDIARPETSYFSNLRLFLIGNTSPIYKLYQLHYRSDVCSVSDIGKGFSAILAGAIASGKFPDRKFIIIAHSMGGLVSRSFMQQTRSIFVGTKWGESVFRLITLATPHHGSPASNQLVRFYGAQPTARALQWAAAAALVSSAYWGIKSGCLRCALSPAGGNRADLRWDSFDALFGPNLDVAQERNDFLSTLNSFTQFDEKIIGYWGTLGDRPEVNLFGAYSAYELGGSAALFTAGSWLNDVNSQGLSSVLIERLMKRDVSNTVTAVNNDGMVPDSSARFDGHSLRKLVRCPKHNHGDMKDGSPLGTVCLNQDGTPGKSLFNSLLDDLPRIYWVNSPPSELTSNQSIPISWRISGAQSVSQTWVEWETYGGSCTPSSPCKSPIQNGNIGNFSATIVIPANSSARYALPIAFRLVAVADGIRITNESEGFVRLVRQASGPKISVSASKLTFGGVATTGEKHLRVSVKNIGTSNLSGTAIIGASFSVSPSGAFVLAPLAEKEFDVKFAPAAVATFSGTLTFASDGGNASVVLTGNGINATTASLPTVVTGSATGLSRTNATLQGTVSPNSSPTQAWFEWGVSAVNENRTSVQGLGNTGSDLSIAQAISGLSPNTTYRFRVIGENGAGVKPGGEQTFTTAAPPAAPLICTSGSLEFASGLEVGPPSQSFTLRNCGTGTLSYGITTDSPWLSLSISSGTSTGEQDSVAVSVNPAGLRPGFYASTVRVSDSASANSPQHVAVYVRVSAPEPARVRRPFAFPYQAGSIGATGWKVRRDSAGNIAVGGIGGADNAMRGVFKYDPEGNPVGEFAAAGYQFAVTPSGSFGVLSVPDGSYQVQVKQHDANGNVQWTQAYAPGEATPQVIESDSNGNYYVGGREVRRVVKNGADPFMEHGLLVKFTAEGGVAWARNIPFIFDFQNARITDVVVTKAGNIFVGGTIRKMSVVVASNGSYSVNTTNDFRPFVAKYDSAGNNLWMTTLTEGAAYTDLSTRIAADDSAEFLLFPSVNPADGRTGYFLAKLNPSGQLVWSEWSSDPEYQLLANSAVVDQAGNLYVAGVAVAGVYNRSGTFVEKFDASGQRQWAHRFAPGPVDLGEYIAGELLSITDDGMQGVIASGGLFGKFPGEGRPWAWKYTKDGVMESMHPPMGVAGASSIPLGVSSLTWTWADGSDELGYRVVSFKSGISSGKLPQDTTTWTMTALSTNTWYEAQAFALNDDGVAGSTAVRACTMAALPASPTVNSQAPFRATLSWSANSNPTGTDYEVFASSLSTPGNFPSARVSGATSAVVAGLLPSTTYYFFVRAVSQAGVPTPLSGSISTFTIKAPQGIASQDLSIFGGTVVASDSRTAVNFAAGIPSEARAFLSKDPLVTPIVTSSADIVVANLAVPVNQRLLAGSIREIVIMAGDAPYESGLSGTLTLPYDDADNDGFVDNLSPPVRPEQLSIHTMSNARWEPVPGIVTVDKTSRTVSVPIAHLSVFAVLATVAAADCGGARVYPVPWKPGAGDKFDSASVAGCGRGLIFDKLTGNATVRIYNIVGDLVRELAVSASDAGCKAWDGKNDAGGDVASGIYFARLSCLGGVRTLKMAIER